ncbi:MAG TPA: phosphatase PAP2 family protein [Kofleriaceae bacterium]|nr:phosphatase PAP2 family protein [Kofleriaceae bacterium]
MAISSTQLTRSPRNRAAAVLAALGPDGVLSAVALVVVATVIARVDGLVVPMATVLPYAVVGVALVAVSAFVQRSRRVVRVWIPFVFLYLCYRALRGVLLLIPDAAGRHAQLRAVDEALLGVSPAWAMESLATPWLTELLAYAYATMFILPLVVLVTLSVRGHERELRRAALGLLVAFYLGFVVFLLVPAKSPDIVYAGEFETELRGYGFYEASMGAWQRLQQITFDAFPSMHTAISTIALVHARRLGVVLVPRHPRAMFRVYLPVVVLLQVATVYLRQHYFVDLMAAWALAALSLWIAARADCAWPRV